MAQDIVIDAVDPADVELMAHLFNQMFQPARRPEHFARRLEGRRNALFMVARIGREAVGFYVGMELKPSVHFAWLVGVAPDARRMGVATRLMQAAASWAREHGYSYLRFECHNGMRAMLHFGIAEGYDIVGVRWDGDLSTNLIIFEKTLADDV